MNEKQFEMAQAQEERQRQQAIEEHRERAQRRFVPYQLGGMPCCPECLFPLEPHRIAAGICVPCLADIERREAR
ncbi:MAG: hypothetical protein M0Q49_02115 [Porticoccaceae bacterium]|nr:hypothetical protein [Porticoccaceae bacterium]